MPPDEIVQLASVLEGGLYEAESLVRWARSIADDEDVTDVVFAFGLRMANEASRVAGRPMRPYASSFRRFRGTEHDPLSVHRECDLLLLVCLAQDGPAWPVGVGRRNVVLREAEAVWLDSSIIPEWVPLEGRGAQWLAIWWKAGATPWALTENGEANYRDQIGAGVSTVFRPRLARRQLWCPTGTPPIPQRISIPDEIAGPAIAWAERQEDIPALYEQWRSGTRTSPGTSWAFMHPVSEWMTRELAKHVSAIIREPVWPAHNGLYAIAGDAQHIPHRDTHPASSWIVSFTLRLSIESWPLYTATRIGDDRLDGDEDSLDWRPLKAWAQATRSPGSLDLIGAGDALIMRGDLIHWRPPIGYAEAICAVLWFANRPAAEGAYVADGSRDVAYKEGAEIIGVGE